ncbi:enoyl-CoA hydratase-related protein [Mesorhizobium sp. SP-1A]|uniref:enoyl-CoA hydratase-related protein n=1 Tax=Mesorhizobium sp. SP-1A TaxID=3077840 RepID=UPI0028F74851|nr:enoyl-CoA hydratase-related protein [Mesorhizobium sp. SP-1A]
MTGFKIEKHGVVLEIVLDRPRANAIDSATSRALNQVLADFNADPGYRAAIFTAEGRFFCTGGDLKEMEAAQNDINYGPNGFAGLTHC